MMAPRCAQEDDKLMLANKEKKTTITSISPEKVSKFPVKSPEPNEHLDEESKSLSSVEDTLRDSIREEMKDLQSPSSVLSEDHLQCIKTVPASSPGSRLIGPASPGSDSGRCSRLSSSSASSSVSSPYSLPPKSRCFIYADWRSNSYTGKRSSKSSKLKLYAEEPVPCAHCKKKIENKHLLHALDKYWHEKCLKCDFCRKPLYKIGQRFYFRQGAKFCQDDFLRTFGGRGTCSSCNECILPSEYVLKFKGGMTYHLDCFKCSKCSAPFCVGDAVKINDPKNMMCKLCTGGTIDTDVKVRKNS
ncbi:uncharacterized protein [Clytia hemisphaerica]|uniref:Rhombotin-2 n=1 Tax=Clytia hemisphaerica TaxID=252671 RepID=A0A7M5X325_9CNID